MQILAKAGIGIPKTVFARETADFEGVSGDAAGESQGAAGTPPARHRARTLAGWAVALVVALSLALGVYDRVLAEKAFFSWHDVHEGDIIVFTHPPLDHCPGPPEGDLVKRVIALPGQTIYSSGNSVYVNGRLLAEPYLPHDDPLGPPIASSQHPYRVPPGEFYLLGDNRAISCDSRYWGPIKGSSIIGKVVLVWWHNDHPDFHRF